MLLSARGWEDLQNASSGRLFPYELSLALITKYPWFGWGIGSFRFVYSKPSRGHSNYLSLIQIEQWYMHPHNEILNQWVELGILGPILFLFCFFLLFIRMGAKLNSISGREKIFAATLLSGLLGIFTSWMFSTNFLFPLSRFWAAVLIGGCIKCCSSHLGSWKEGLKVSKSVAVLVVVLSVIPIISYDMSLLTNEMAYRSQQPQKQKSYHRFTQFLSPRAFHTELYSAFENDEPSQLQKDYPAVPMTWYVSALTDYHHGKFESAQKNLLKVLTIEPSYIPALDLLEQIQYRLKPHSMKTDPFS